MSGGERWLGWERGDRERDRRPRAGAGAEWRALAPAPSAECVSESHGWGQGSHRDSVRAGSVARAAPGGAECDQGAPVVTR